MTDSKPLSLSKQLELSRFHRALEVAESLAENRALLTTAELERMNKILTGKTDSPWRNETTTLTLPSGKSETFTLHSDPKMIARDHLHHATEASENGHPIDAAVFIYAELVLSHCFKDANRRTAVIAAHYFLKRYDTALSGIALYEMGLGDLRDLEHREELSKTVHQMARFSGKSKL